MFIRYIWYLLKSLMFWDFTLTKIYKEDFLSEEDLIYKTEF